MSPRYQTIYLFLILLFLTICAQFACCGVFGAKDPSVAVRTYNNTPYVVEVSVYDIKEAPSTMF